MKRYEELGKDGVLVRGARKMSNNGFRGRELSLAPLRAATDVPQLLVGYKSS